MELHILNILGPTWILIACMVIYVHWCNMIKVYWMDLSLYTWLAMTLSYTSSLLHGAVTPIYIWAPPPCKHKHHHHMKSSRIMAGLVMNGRSSMRFASDLKSYLYIYPNTWNEGLDQHGVDMASYSKFSLKLPTYIIVQNAIFGAIFWTWEWKSGKVSWVNVEAHMM